MEVKFAPELEKSLNEIAEQRGTAPSELVEEVMADYVIGLRDVRSALDSRYDDLASGRVQPIDAEEFIEGLLRSTRVAIKKSQSD